MFKKENYLMLVLVIGFGLFNTNLIAQDDAEEDVEEVVVTGSRIATSEFTGAQPVVVIDQEDIARTAELSVAEVLRELPINITGSLELVLLATYSVIPGNFFFKKCFFDTGPFIRNCVFFSFSILKLKSKDFLI